MNLWKCVCRIACIPYPNIRLIPHTAWRHFACWFWKARVAWVVLTSRNHYSTTVSDSFPWKVIGQTNNPTLWPLRIAHFSAGMEMPCVVNFQRNVLMDFDNSIPSPEMFPAPSIRKTSLKKKKIVRWYYGLKDCLKLRIPIKKNFFKTLFIYF